MAVKFVQTVEADVLPSVLASAGMTLAHEHLYASFGKASNDPDLEFTDTSAIAYDLATAKAGGVGAVVEMSTYDMGCDPPLVRDLATEAGIHAIKSTGWFRSPSADEHAAAVSTEAMTERMILDVEQGFEGTTIRAGVVGEVGMRSTSPTSVEQRILEATVAASIKTGAGIAAHTDDWSNAAALVEGLDHLGAPADRIMLCHARCSDPLDEHLSVARAGVYLAFDQLGHPQRDPPDLVADRILELVENGQQNKVVVSCDVGRASRLTRAGGSGYLRGIADLKRRLLFLGAEFAVVRAITQENIGAFLSFPSR